MQLFLRDRIWRSSQSRVGASVMRGAVSSPWGIAAGIDPSHRVRQRVTAALTGYPCPSGHRPPAGPETAPRLTSAVIGATGLVHQGVAAVSGDERALALTPAGAVIGQLDELQDLAEDYPPARVA